jgi:hypothetical protein
MQAKLMFILIAIAVSASAQKDYAAGEIQSKESIYHYGRYEMMMYSSDVSGTTSTFFLWKDYGYEPNVYWNELDIETFGKSPNEWQSNPIWEYDNNDAATKRWEEYHDAIPIANTWVKFALEWTPDYIAWFNNDIEVRRIVLGENVPAGHHRYNSGDSRDPVQYIRDPMRICFNHWATYPGEWLGPWNDADLPSYQFVDWFTYQEWNGSGFNPVSIRQDFNSYNELTDFYNISTHTFAENQCDFSTNAVGVVNGYMWLGIFNRGQESAPTGNQIPPPPSDVNTQPGANIIVNGEFDNGTTGWEIHYNNATAGTFTVVTNQNMSGINAAQICATTPGTANWHVQLNQNAPLISGKHYEIAFIAKASAERTIDIAIQMEGSPWTTYFDTLINLTTTNQRFSFIYSPIISDATSKFKFYFGTNSACVFLDSVVYKEIEAPKPPTAIITPAGATTFCAGGSVVLNSNTGTGYTYQWLLNNIVIAEATASTYTATQEGSYTLSVTSNRLSAISEPIVVGISATPTAPTVVSPVRHEQNQTASKLTATGTNLLWYQNAATGTGSAAAPTPNTSTTGTFNHYVSQTVNGCESNRSHIQVIVQFTEPTQTINLYTGWNLISFNVQPTNNTIQAIFANANISIVKNNDGFFLATQNAAFNSLTTIELGKAYLVYAQNPTTISVSGTQNTALQTHLREGWNMVGVPLTTQATITSKIQGTTIQAVKNFDGFYQTSGSTNSITNFVPGLGYYIYATGTGSLSW